jgi:hypothetical protein
MQDSKRKSYEKSTLVKAGMLSKAAAAEAVGNAHGFSYDPS